MEEGDVQDKLSSTKPAQDASKQVKLERRIGLASATSMIVGVIVGSGIFVSPKDVLQNTGSISSALLIWSLCGFLSLLGALCLAELGTSIPTSGGDYAYINMAYGPCVSFLYLWATVLIILPCSNAIAALTFANYVMQPFFDIDCKPPEAAVQSAALAVIMLLVFINCHSVSISIKLQDSFTMTKVLALILIISYGFYNVVNGKNDHLARTSWSEGSIWDISILAQGFYSGFYSYAGWNALNFVTEEIKDPVKNIPRAIVLSMTLVTTVYVLANLAYFSVLGKQEILISDAIAVTYAKYSFGKFNWIMPILVGLSTISGLNALIYSSSRILFVGARKGQLFQVLNMLSMNGCSPVPSLIFVGFVSVIYLSSTNIAFLIHYLTFAEAGFGTLAVSTLLVLRYKEPDRPRPLRIPLAIPIIYLIIATFMIISPIYNNPFGALIGLMILALGFPVYLFSTRRQDGPSAYSRKINQLTALIQKLTMSVLPSDNEGYIH